MTEASLHDLAATLQSAADAIISIDAAGTIESVNPAVERVFGYAPEEIIGQNVKMLMPEPHRSRHDGYIRRYCQTDQRKIIGIGGEVVGQRKDGSTFPMHLSVSGYEIGGERHFAGIVHDLTAQKQAEANSLRQETLFGAVIDDSPQAIIITDVSRNIFLVNPAVRRMFGYEPGDLIGQNSRTLYATDDDYERVAIKLNADTALNGLCPIRVTYRRKSGETFPGEIVATIIRDSKHGILGLMGLVRDLTEQLKQEEALRKAQRMEALGQLTGGIAHDFNNLLTVIIGNHELFQQDPRAPEAVDLIRRANEAAEMGARLAKRLLSFSRQRKLEPTIVTLNAKIIDMADMLRRSLGETIAISTSMPPDLWSVRADPSEIENAVLNLCINARDAMPHGGKLIIETQNMDLGANDAFEDCGLSPGDYVRLSVSDTGSGMPPEVIARAFEPFFTTKPAGRGTGLGLASIYGFVKESGGNATIHSEPGRGTTVNLYLPRAATHDPRASQAMAERPAHSNGETILVVEDNSELRKLSLRRLALLGYRAIEADSGTAALAVLDAGNRIDLIFSDVIMPGGMTGYDLACRARERCPSVKILLTSGYAPDATSAQDTTASELKVLRKPYRQAELASVLRELLAN